MADGYQALTEREKQTLRLIVRGHDAKSTARHLGLSVHTINERLRDARRKLEVSSSREAARLLLQHERDPEPVVDKQMGDDAQPQPLQDVGQPTGDSNLPRRSVRFATGVVLMSLVFGLLALVTLPSALPQADAPATVSPAGDPQVEAVAQRWLTLLDESRWAESWASTGTAFRKLNTRARWAAVSQRVRAPLGAVRSRTLLSHDELPAPPHGYDVVKFRTDFASKAGAVETVALDREGGIWRVVGVYVE